ncbi:phosphoesterase [bacterium]|nr:phosphoesterase [bacterium]|tara:strand:+ start:22923 stop:23852 length:930 start_codon:yes stop_codon:yes gene_type:complete
MGTAKHNDEKVTTPQKNDGIKGVGIYHKDCLDGTAAAAVLSKKFPDVLLRPLSHRYEEEVLNNIVEEIDGETIVYIVDFSLREGHSEKLIEKAKEVVNIDHHIGSEEKLEILDKNYSNFSFVFDNERSGASLTWIYFFGEEDIPQLIKYIEDSDIWRFTYGDNTRYAVSYLYQFSGHPEKMLDFIDASKEEIEKILRGGKMIKEYRDGQRDVLLRDVSPINLKIKEHVVPVHNTPEFLRSDVGHVLATQLGKTVATFVINGDVVRLHFRGNDEHEPSALELAKILGGGGHRNAAAASVSLGEFFELVEK